MIKEQIKQTVVAQYNNDWHSIVVYKNMQNLKNKQIKLTGPFKTIQQAHFW